jgi:hypothetical protein
MKRQLALACTCALLAMMALPAFASNGDIKIIAEASGGSSENTRECDFWSFKYRGNAQGNAFGSCTQVITLKVYADLKGASAGGITGCEFKGLVGPNNAADPGWLFSELPNPSANVRLGNAFRPPDPASRGLRQSWDVCQTGTNNNVLIEEVILARTAACGPQQMPATLEIKTGAHNVPSNVFFLCPLFTLCDDPAFTKVCLGDNITQCRTPVPPFCPNCSQCSTSGLFTINPVPEKGLGDCTKLAKAGAVASEPQTWSQMKGLYR